MVKVIIITMIGIIRNLIFVIITNDFVVITINNLDYFILSLEVVWNATVNIDFNLELNLNFMVTRNTDSNSFIGNLINTSITNFKVKNFDFIIMEFA